MRLTVGPLPPAVYWRRRAVVLGAVLLFVLVLTYSCAKSDSPAGDPRASGATGQTQNPAPSASVRASPTGLLAAGDATPSPAPSDAANPSAGETSPGGPSAGTDPDACTDDEISVVAVPAQETVPRGASVEISLQIKNTSERTCTRDLGSLQQELYLKIGAQKAWSSDACSTGRDSDVKSMEPNIVHQYQLAWNGRDSTKCAGGVASGPYPAPGSYLVFGRVGSKLSEPAPLSISG